MKRALTFTMIAGTRKCVCDCQICISKMTPSFGLTLDGDFNKESFKKALIAVDNYDARIALITGKGEPLLYPNVITKYLFMMHDKKFHRIELQTNGFLLMNAEMDNFLDVWSFMGLDVIAISIYHYNDKKNSEVFRPVGTDYCYLENMIKAIHKHGIKVRLSCVMLKGYIDNIKEVQELIKFAKENNIFQLTLRMADSPKISINDSVSKFVSKNRITESVRDTIHNFIAENSNLCDELPYGAMVYDMNGQNICITTGLINDTKNDNLRHLIFFPEGILTDSWTNVAGGRIL